MTRHLLPVYLALVASLALLAGCSPSRQKFTVGGGTSTEQQLLTEIMAQQIESKTGLDVQRRTGFPSVETLHQALTVNEIDLYAESATAIAATVLKELPEMNPEVVMLRVKSELERVHNCQVVTPLGYNSPFALAIRSSEADEKKLKTIGEAEKVAGWEVGTTPEFQARADGYSTMQRTYRLQTRSANRTMKIDEAYRLLKDSHITMVAGSATDAALLTPEIRMLEDDEKGFPPAQVCAFTRSEVMRKRPEMGQIIGALNGKFTTELVRKLNAEVELKHRPVKEVAEGFLAGRIR